MFLSIVGMIRKMFSTPVVGGERRQRSASSVTSATVAVGILIVICRTGHSADIQYARDIRPILADNCFSCHGTDDAHREADLRLDQFAAATAKSGEQAAIVPGHPELSQLVQRVTSTDPDLRMPPADSGKSLSEAQIATLQQWISEGAAYQSHWAFVPPTRPGVPAVDDPWISNPVDAFILQKLRDEGLQPSERAAPSVALRRLALDLIGLPPTLEQLQQFESQLLADGRDAAWQRQMTEMLSSPHFGEKWGRHWLDAARYADSDGFEKDKPRFVWFYRDWVMNAMNEDLPYDQFLLQQLAGDLLPNRTQDQLVATGFLRNSMINEEGGIDPEQFRMEAMFDRMDAIGKAMLGLTIQCAQCHNHKYDPVSHHDYYRMFAFLNNCDEAQATVYTPSETQQRTQILTDLAKLQQTALQSIPNVRRELETWVKVEADQSKPWTVLRPELDASGGQKHFLLEDGSILAQGYAPTKHTTEFTANVTLPVLTGFRLELLNDGNLPHGGPGRSVDGLSALSEFQVRVRELDASGKVRSDAKEINVKLTSATADVNPPERPLADTYADKSKQHRTTGPVAFAIDGDPLTAWGQDVGGGRSNVPRNAVFVPADPLESAHGFQVTIRLMQMHGGWNSDDNQNNNLGRFRLSVTEQASPQASRLSQRQISRFVNHAEQLTDADYLQVFDVWRTTQDHLTELNAQIEALWQQHPRGTTQLVLQERRQLRPTYLLTRGDFLKPEERVEPGVPQWLNEDFSDPAADRMAFARWMVDPKTPTPARAIVNRIWQEYFGTGIVQTAEDLGTQSEFPSHPQLLDWLAVELIENGWSLKHIHRLIVTSSTYQQSSHVTAELYERDPENRLLARGPRFRVAGETVRDVALAASGLLNRKFGGPGVYPPAPEFLFLPPASYGPKIWATESGPERYRRAVYTFRFRSVPYPVLENFDTPRGDTSCVRRNRSNTPIQALTTLNEELFMECARALAFTAVSETKPADLNHAKEPDHTANNAAILTTMMRRCLSRPATEQEQATLLNFLQQQTARLSSSDDATAWQLAAMDPDMPPALPQGQTPQQLAAWTAVARVILNLDETITKE